jgi:hypothetical protein
MPKDRLPDEQNILEAVDNLSSMADINIEELKLEKASDLGDGIQTGGSRWFDPKNAEKTYDSIKNTFKTVHKYLQHIYTKEGAELKDIAMQKGVQSILSLAREAAFKVDRCRTVFTGGEKRGSITESKEFKELEDFYENKVLKRFQEVLDSEEAWKEEWEKEEDIFDIERKGLKNLEAVTRDRDYELFYILKEDGSKFYNRNLIRHIRLVANFDQVIGQLGGDDPLIRVRTVLDKQAMLSASAIKNESFSQINSWIKGAKHHKEAPLVRDIHTTLMSLMLASNQRHLIPHTNGKNCFAYFIDFQRYIREIVEHIDYKSLIDNPPDDPDHFLHRTATLIHTLCFHYLIHQIDQSSSYELFARMMEQSTKNSSQDSHNNLISFWTDLLEEHEALYAELKQFPSGPLFKVLDILNDQEEDLFFDPYLEQARPFILYHLHYKQEDIGCMRFPCPTKQNMIDKADILEEYKAALRHLADRQHQEKVLLINLQDRTSWQEYARCKVLEDFRMHAEFKQYMYYLNFPKNSPFYLQSDIYIVNNHAGDFKALILEQVLSGPSCGFCFPSHMHIETMKPFLSKAIDLVHEYFFASKELLSRKNRLDFIEIFYHFFLLKIIDEISPRWISFVCKDGVDVSSMQTGSFYAFIKMLTKDDPWTEEDKDYLRILFFTPAILIRERVVDIQRFSRTISMLSVVMGALEGDKNAILKAFTPLYSEKFFNHLKVKR